MEDFTYVAFLLGMYLGGGLVIAIMLTTKDMVDNEVRPSFVIMIFLWPIVFFMITIKAAAEKWRSK